jgi:hypothetical protein
MTTPGVGVIVALTFACAIGDPSGFKSSKAVRAFVRRQPFGNLWSQPLQCFAACPDCNTSPGKVASHFSAYGMPDGARFMSSVSGLGILVRGGF